MRTGTGRANPFAGGLGTAGAAITHRRRGGPCPTLSTDSNRTTQTVAMPAFVGGEIVLTIRASPPPLPLPHP